MSINIGNGNKIKNSVISEGVINVESNNKKDNFFQKHPVIAAIIATVVGGVILLFGFWGNIVDWIEGIF